MLDNGLLVSSMSVREEQTTGKGRNKTTYVTYSNAVAMDSLKGDGTVFPIRFEDKNVFSLAFAASGDGIKVFGFYNGKVDSEQENSSVEGLFSATLNVKGDISGVVFSAIPDQLLSAQGASSTKFLEGPLEFEEIISDEKGYFLIATQVERLIITVTTNNGSYSYPATDKSNLYSFGVTKSGDITSANVLGRYIRHRGWYVDKTKAIKTNGNKYIVHSEGLSLSVPASIKDDKKAKKAYEETHLAIAELNASNGDFTRKIIELDGANSEKSKRHKVSAVVGSGQDVFVVSSNIKQKTWLFCVCFPLSFVSKIYYGGLFSVGRLQMEE